MNWTRDQVIGFIRRIGDGETTHEVFPTAGARWAFYELIDTDRELAERYARAQCQRAEDLAGEIIRIADTELDPAKARNRIEARKWIASKLKPSKYGDRLDLTVTGAVDLIGAIKTRLAAHPATPLLPRDADNPAIPDAELIPRLGATDSPSVAPLADDGEPDPFA